MRRVVVLAALVCALLGASSILSGCGPIISTYLIVSAQAELDGAKAAEAEKYAVYEYTSADQFLYKAREEQGYADFGPSIDYAYKADDMAKKANARAQDERKRQADLPSAEWQAPTDGSSGEQPSVIIKKKDDKKDPVKVKVVPIPTDEGPAPK
jgi:hypothetical protein